jgi:predicted ArsR family transcriptional regulator
MIKEHLPLSDEKAISTREKVLRILMRKHRCTINELAEAVEINPISVRHHIAKLEADGLIASEEERHGIGRPRRVYFLTERGREYFPTRYMHLTLRLLKQLKEKMPSNMIDQLFASIANELIEDYSNRSELEGLTLEQRLELLSRFLSEEGFEIEWEKQGNVYHIREVSCPYFHIGLNHPEVCRVDQTLISTLLNVPAEKIHCVLNGDNFCTYVVPTLERTEENG